MLSVKWQGLRSEFTRSLFLLFSLSFLSLSFSVHFCSSCNMFISHWLQNLSVCVHLRLCINCTSSCKINFAFRKHLQVTGVSKWFDLLLMFLLQLQNNHLSAFCSLFRCGLQRQPRFSFAPAMSSSSSSRLPPQGGLQVVSVLMSQSNVHLLVFNWIKMH